MSRYVNVAIDNKSEQTDAFFTYEASWEVGVGAKVTVPFAKRKKPVDAYVTEVDVVPSFDVSKIKPITEYNKERSLTKEMIDLAVWMRRRYGVKYIDAIKMFTVNGKRLKEGKPISDEPNPPGYNLTSEQKTAAEQIIKPIDAKQFDAFLLKGVTNSGKTEVYMKAVEKALEQGRTAIVLLPEIALSNQTEERFKKRFGAKKVATLHSKLSTSKKLEEWMRIRSGEARIVVGPRTSIFAPLEDIGVIIIDEEHEGTYKSDHNPKYETIDVAYMRAKLNDAVLVLGSATPSIVSYYRCEQGIYKLIEMKHRVGESVLPTIETVDMRGEARKGNLTCISEKLAKGITESLSNREQIILFLNRRGYSTQIVCLDCGNKMMCEECGVTLTYHKSMNAAVCHYCGKKKPLPKVCPDCGSEFIKYAGSGTEKVEELVKKLWPEANVERFDIDTATSQREMKKVLESFRKGKTDILVGTQLLAKGLDFQNVGLVGIINADVSLNIPDYRSPERTYQLITQVAGRAGRAGGESMVYIQTYDPESSVIMNAEKADYEEFYADEVLHRNIMNYPPFSDIISVTFVDKSDKTECALSYANNYRDSLKKLTDLPKGTVILRPREDERRTDGKARATFIIKAPNGSRGGFIKAYMNMRERMIKASAPCYIEIDVNPYGIV